MVNKYSNIFIRDNKQSKSIRISSESKPEIIDSIIEKWQSLLDTIAGIKNIPAAVVMRFDEKTREVFLSSNSKSNPYKVGEVANLNTGLYCETVIGLQEMLLIPNAAKNELWNENNADINIGMIAYLGFPVNWPDGEVFGTVCILDGNEKQFSKECIMLLKHVKLNIETDLQYLVLNSELKEKNLQLEKLNFSKSRFLSLISHDVRGGIGIIDEFLKLLVENWKSYDEEKIISIIGSLSQSASSAYLTLDNLLNWSKNELASLNADKTKIDVIQLVEDLLDYFRQAIAMKNLTVEKEYYAKKAFVIADENMLNVSFRNILSNAIKYTPDGGRITMRVLPVGTQHRIEFEDSGVGMNSDTLNRLFTYDKFHRKYGTNGEESAGVGLILTKDFLDKNNAKIEVKSELNKGTNFKVTI